MCQVPEDLRGCILDGDLLSVVRENRVELDGAFFSSNRSVDVADVAVLSGLGLSRVEVLAEFTTTLLVPSGNLDLNLSSVWNYYGYTP